MNKAGVFGITGSFHVTGHGLVAVGKILEGTVKTGQQISVKIAGKEVLLKIAGIAISKLQEDGSLLIGLHLLHAPGTTALPANVALEEQTAEVFG